MQCMTRGMTRVQLVEANETKAVAKVMDRSRTRWKTLDISKLRHKPPVTF